VGGESETSEEDFIELNKLSPLDTFIDIAEKNDSPPHVGDLGACDSCDSVYST